MTVNAFVGSRVDHVVFDGNPVFIKRDDLLDPAFSGNKARKLYYLLENNDMNFTKVISYGSPQSNFLYSLSELAKLKKWECDFYVDHVPQFLQDNPAGNYLRALNNGANIISIHKEKATLTIEEHINRFVLPSEERALFIPEGGRSPFAEQGIKRLAEEITLWAETEKMDDVKIMLPSGTGTTALYLQKHLGFEVLTCTCVGADEYLEEQFQTLSKGEYPHPTILPMQKKYHFGKVYREFYDIWLSLKKQTGIEFELLYDPLGWLMLQDYMKSYMKSHMQNLKDNVKQVSCTPILYIHQGGLLGNETMLPRYSRMHRVDGKRRKA